MDRRQLLGGMGALAALAQAPALHAEPGDTLANIAATVPPISKVERLERVARLQARLRLAGLGAVLIEAGSSLDYFTGIQWWRSERMTAALIPADGDPLVVTPFFEAPSISEMLAVPAEVRTWDEHQDPMALVAGWLRKSCSAARPTLRVASKVSSTTSWLRSSLLKRMGAIHLSAQCRILRQSIL